MKYRDKQIELPGRKQRGLVTRPGEVEVRCALMYKTETQRAWLKLSVRSNVNPNCWNHSEVDADLETKELENQVRYTAETLARFQCMNHRDQHNPPEVAKAAVEALQEVLSKAAEARKLMA